MSYCVLPLFTERAAKCDVLLHCGVEQPGLLGSVGHRVSVLAEVHHGKKKDRYKLKVSPRTSCEEHEH